MHRERGYRTSIHSDLTPSCMPHLDEADYPSKGSGKGSGRKKGRKWASFRAPRWAREQIQITERDGGKRNWCAAREHRKKDGRTEKERAASKSLLPFVIIITSSYEWPHCSSFGGVHSTLFYSVKRCGVSGKVKWYHGQKPMEKNWGIFHIPKSQRGLASFPITWSVIA